MKKAFTIIGYVCAGLFGVALILALIFIPRALRLEHDGAAYLDRSLPEIVGKWDPQELISRATPELIASTKSPAELERLFRYLKVLGALKHLDEPTGNVSSGTSTAHGPVTVGNFTAKAEFEGGSATIVVQIKREADEWKINGFHVNSNAFLPK